MKTRGTLTWLAAIAVAGTISGATARAGDVEAGKKIYEEKKCGVCHELAGVAGKMAKLGGKLDGVGAKRDAAWLTKYLTDPKSVQPDAKMKKVNFTPKELEDVVAYMESIKS